MLIAQIAAGLAVGMPFAGAQSGQAMLVGSKPIEVPGIPFVSLLSERNTWLVNDKGFVVRSFPPDVNVEEVVSWRRGASLPIGYVAPDPRATVVALPKLLAPRHWVDVIAIGMRLAKPDESNPSRNAKGLLVLFLSTYGPADHLYAERLNEIHKAASDAGIDTLALFPGKAETKSSIVRFSTLMALEFPCALDPGNAYADAYRATRTPEAFLLDSNKRVVYTGAIDTSTFGGESAKPYLLNAVRALGTGAKIPVATSRVFGTPIDR